MKKEYDFSKGERGKPSPRDLRSKFFRPGARFNLPVYLDPVVEARLASAARKRGEDLSQLVNRLLKREIELAEVLQ
jgi:hypothetical protein